MTLQTMRTALCCAALACLMAAGAAHAAPEKQHAISAASMDAFWWGDFAALERQQAGFMRPGSFEPDGSEQLDLFRRGLARVYGNKPDHAEDYFLELDRLTLEWATAHPLSPLAHILHARALQAHGWSYRGGKYAREVPDDAMRQFEQYLQRAAAYLRLHADVAFRDSYAHLTLLELGRALSWEHQQILAIAREGLARNPEDIDLYFEVANGLLPKWGGDARALDTYIKEATEQSRPLLGNGMYALLYSAAANNQFEHALFKDSFADWDKVQQGYEELLARYPASNGRRNRYAWMACMAKDRPTLMRLLGVIGTDIDLDAWGDNPERSLEACRRWATQL